MDIIYDLKWDQTAETFPYCGEEKYCGGYIPTGPDSGGYISTGPDSGGIYIHRTELRGDIYPKDRT